ncbi:hypothetical protein GCM10027285_26860 [Oleiagrimonas citrea]
MQRVARVQEAEAMLELALAVSEEHAQEEVVDAATERVNVAQKVAGEIIRESSTQIGRLVLMRELCDRLGERVDHESASLSLLREVSADRAQKRSSLHHYRSRVEEAGEAAAMEDHASKARSQAETAIQGWILNRYLGGL